jgi:hypothetical protein
VPITFDCPCGKSLRVDDEHAGRRVKCPVCGAITLVPSANPQSEVENEDEEPQFEIIEDEPRQVPRARPAKSTSPDDDDEPRPRKGRSDRDDDDDDYDDDDDKPRRRKKKKRRRPSPSRSMPIEEQHDYRGRGDSDLEGTDLFLCICCPGIGCIVGMLRLITGSGEGGKMVALSLVFAVIWNVLGFAVRSAMK